MNGSNTIDLRREQSSIASATSRVGLTVGCMRNSSSRPALNEFTPAYDQTFVRERPCWPSSNELRCVLVPCLKTQIISFCDRDKLPSPPFDLTQRQMFFRSQNDRAPSSNSCRRWRK